MTYKNSEDNDLCKDKCLKIIGVPQINIRREDDEIIIDIYAHLSREISLDDLGHTYILIKIYEGDKIIQEEMIEPVPGTDYIGEDIVLKKNIDPSKLFVEIMLVNKRCGTN